MTKRKRSKEEHLLSPSDLYDVLPPVRSVSQHEHFISSSILYKDTAGLLTRLTTSAIEDTAEEACATEQLCTAIKATPYNQRVQGEEQKCQNSNSANHSIIDISESPPVSTTNHSSLQTGTEEQPEVVNNSVTVCSRQEQLLNAMLLSQASPLVSSTSQSANHRVYNSISHYRETQKKGVTACVVPLPVEPTEQHVSSTHRRVTCSSKREEACATEQLYTAIKATPYNQSVQGEEQKCQNSNSADNSIIDISESPPVSTTNHSSLQTVTEKQPEIVSNSVTVCSRQEQLLNAMLLPQASPLVSLTRGSANHRVYNSISHYRETQKKSVTACIVPLPVEPTEQCVSSTHKSMTCSCQRVLTYQELSLWKVSRSASKVAYSADHRCHVVEGSSKLKNRPVHRITWS